jgi:predicted SAM-dependent methyltransferase
MRLVGEESRKSYEDKIRTGFFEKYMSGKGLEIGGTGYLNGVVPILDTATNIDIDYLGYDGKTLPFPNESQDYIYSSHCLEHISDYNQALREWMRVLKVGGHMVISVPHQFLYEKRKNKPSRWNGDHKRFYTPASLLKEIEEAFKPNSYRVRYLADEDNGFDYSVVPENHSCGRYEIEVVIQKIASPSWELE